MTNQLKKEVYDLNIDFITEEFNKLRIESPSKKSLAWTTRFNNMRDIITLAHEREILMAKLVRCDYSLTLSFEMLGIDPHKPIEAVDLPGHPHTIEDLRKAEPQTP